MYHGPSAFQEAPIVKFCVLASGSSGNCTLVATARTRLLVDAGLSAKEVARRLLAIGEQFERIDAILITHEHSDHVSALPVLARKLRAPVYLSDQTAPTIDWNECKPPVECFRSGTSLRIGDIDVDTFTIPHDAADPVGLCLRVQGVKIGLVTDLGYIPASVRFHLRGVHLLMLESNHDIEMLKVGPYPWMVKQRVMGRKGHLSNDVVADFIRADLDGCTEALVLGHLSENNNHPELVRLVARQALDGRGLSTKLVVAEHRCQTEVFRL